MQSAPTILQTWGPMMSLYLSIRNRYVKSERGYCVLICWWDKPLSVSKNSSPSVHNSLCKHMCKTEFYRVWKIACKDVHVSLIMKYLYKKWDRFLYICLWGNKTSFIFVLCIFYLPQYALQSYDLTGIFCKKCFPSLFNISKTIIAVRKVREVLVDGPLKNIKFLQFFKIHLGLITIVSEKQWLKH